MIDENFLKSIYVLMVSLGLTKVEIDKELVIKSDDPPLYMTYDNKSKKYVFTCVVAGNEDEPRSSWDAAKQTIDNLLFKDPTNLYLDRRFYKKYENEINSYLSVRGYQIVMEDYGNIYFEKMLPKKGWLKYE